MGAGLACTETLLQHRGQTRAVNKSLKKKMEMLLDEFEGGT